MRKIFEKQKNREKSSRRFRSKRREVEFTNDGPVRKLSGTSFGKEDIDPRTTVTVKEESDGRDALEETIPRVIPEEDSTDKPQCDPRRTSNAGSVKPTDSSKKLFAEGAKLVRPIAPVL